MLSISVHVVYGVTLYVLNVFHIAQKEIILGTKKTQHVSLLKQNHEMITQM